MPTLKEITTRAKKIRKAKPRTKWQNAIKQASKELKAKYRKKEGKVGAKKKAVAKPKRKRIAAKRVFSTKSIGGWMNDDVKEYIDMLKKRDAWLEKHFDLWLEGSYNINTGKRNRDALNKLYDKGITKPAQIRALRSLVISNWRAFIKDEFRMSDYQLKKANEAALTNKQLEAYTRRLMSLAKEKYREGTFPSGGGYKYY
jgi:hypothetical protein